MAENSGISWTTHTFNPWMGCTKVSPACRGCYAERDMDHRHKKVQWGPDGTRVLTGSDNWKKPIKWNKDHAWQQAEVYANHGPTMDRPRVFCASLSDIFENWQGEIKNSQGDTMMVCPNGHVDGSVWEETPESIECSQECGADMRPMTMDDVRIRLFQLIDATPHLDWLLLTKRPENILKMINKIRLDGGTTGRVPEFDIDTPAHPYFRKNVWLGCSVENQEYADKRIPELLKCRDLAPVLFLSCEPLLGPVDLSDALCIEHDRDGSWRQQSKFGFEPRIDWVIGGGESGPKARPTNVDWARSLRDQCQAVGVPFHWKQNGEWVGGVEFGRDDGNYVECQHGEVIKIERGVPVHYWDEHNDDWRNHESDVAVHVGTKKSGRLLDGGLHDAFPKVGS
jgi:protein gp37